MTKLVLIALATVGVGAFAYSRNHSSDKEQIVTTRDTTSAASPQQPTAAAAASPNAPGVDPEKANWSNVDWSQRLTPQQFHIMRQAGTERAFTGEYWDFFKDGQYNCRGCGLPLFKSDAKFDSHCGWPSFDEAINKDAVVEIEDNSGGMHRIEVRCRRCNAHLGHIFDDGPTATGMRYCMNSASIHFEPKPDATTPGEKSKEPAKKP
jgi:peptide-methionine (R)-S-oxide reductase